MHSDLLSLLQAVRVLVQVCVYGRRWVHVDGRSCVDVVVFILSCCCLSRIVCLSSIYGRVSSLVLCMCLCVGGGRGGLGWAHFSLFFSLFGEWGYVGTLHFLKAATYSAV